MRAVTAVTVFAAAVMFGSIAGAAPAVSRAEFTTSLLDIRTLDIGPPGSSVGDALIRRLRLTTRGGKAVGFGYEDCRWITNTVRLCHIVYDLPTGSVVLQGTVMGTPQPVAITGGTGEYFGKDGQATWRGRTVRLTFAP